MYCVPNPDGRGGYKVDLVVLAAVEWVQVYSERNTLSVIRDTTPL
jgi:hypothetical protein